MNKWFRLYDEVVDDPKVQRLQPVLFKAWINFMCIASKNTAKRGTLPPIGDVAYRLHVTQGKAEDLLKGLVDAGLFEWKNGEAYSHNWEGRQYESDCSTTRVKRFRNVSSNGKRNVTETADETDQIQNRTDTETEGVSYSPDFEIVWAVYPKKVGKGEAWKSWCKLKPSRALQDIIFKAIGEARKSLEWTKDNGQYVPNFSTWLNQKRWDDELTPMAKAARMPL